MDKVNFIKRIFAGILVCVCALGGNAIHATAREADNLIWVGWSEYANVMEIDEQGNHSGYFYDYLKEISNYSGVKFQIVDNCTWEDVKNGNVDIMGFIKSTPERDEALDYVPTVIAHHSILITCLTQNHVKYYDYKSLENATIAVEDKVVFDDELTKELNSRGISISYDFLQCKDAKEVQEALEDGRADYALKAAFDTLDENECAVANFGEGAVKIAVQKGNTHLLLLLDSALEQINETDEEFTNRLAEKYFSANIQNKFVLSAQEKAFLENLGTLKIITGDQRGYLSRLEDGKFVGIEPAIMESIAKRLGISYEYVQQDGKSLGQLLNDNAYDLGMGIDYNYTTAEQAGMNVTAPFLQLPYVKIYNKSLTAENRESEVVACIAGTEVTESYVLHNYSPEQILYCGNAEECYKVVDDGRANVTFSSKYVAEYYLSGYYYHNLSTSLIDYTSTICIGVNEKEDTQLVRLLSKAINDLSEREIQNIINANTVPPKVEMTPIVYMHLYPNRVVGYGIVVVTVAAVIVSLLVIAANNKKKNEELKKQRDRATEAARMAMEANNAKSMFLSRMSHEIRTPMNAILGLASLGEDVLQDPEAVKDYFTKIRDAGNFLLALINDILDMSRIDSQKVELHEEVIDGPAFLQSIVDLIRPIADEKNIELAVDFSEAQTPFIKMDRMRSEQIYVNLLNNAVKFSEEGSRVEWTVSDKMVDANHIHMTAVIKDYGCGMSKEFMNHIFEPFSQEENQYSNTKNGTGLGLAIVKNLVTQMGGSIHVESELGKGSTFTFELTREAVLENPDNKQDAKPDQEILKGKRVLLAEDNDINAMVATIVLEKAEMIVERAENGEQAVAMMKDSTPGYFDLILMDVRMPVMDGLEATKNIRSMDRTDAHTIPIIAMTADAFTEDEIRTKEAGMNAHLTKPIERQKMYEILEIQLAQK